MRTTSTKILLSSLGIILTSIAISGCATHDAKRDDETHKRPTQAEKQQTEPSTEK